MTNIADIQLAVRDRISPEVEGWNPLWFEPRTIPAPAFAVMPRDPWANLSRAQGNSSGAKWHMQIGLYLAVPTKEAEEAAWLKMSDLTGTRGAIMTRLRDRYIEDDLYRLVGRSVKFVQGRGLKVVNRNNARILPAYIEFDCITSS